MAKRRDHDSTMDLSLSQLVVPKPPKAPPRGMNPNDVSVWGQLVVGTSDFAPPPRKRAAHAPLWIGLGVVGTLAVAAAVYVMFMRPTTESQASAAVPAAAAAAKPGPSKAEPAKPATPATKAAATSTPPKTETPAKPPEKPAEPIDPQKALDGADPVFVGIRSLVAMMRSAFMGVSSLDPKKTITVAKKPVLKKKPVRPVKRRR